MPRGDGKIPLDANHVYHIRRLGAMGSHPFYVDSTTSPTQANYADAKDQGLVGGHYLVLNVGAVDDEYAWKCTNHGNMEGHFVAVQGASGCTRTQQGAPECTRMDQNASGCKRMRQDASECTRIH